MAGWISDNTLDASLSYISSNTEALHILSAAPATNSYSDISGTTLGNKATPSFTGPAAGDTSGRKITVDAITGGSVTGTGTATHWALVKDSATSELLAWGTLSSLAVSTGNAFTLTAIDIEIPDPA